MDNIIHVANAGAHMYAVQVEVSQEGRLPGDVVREHGDSLYRLLAFDARPDKVSNIFVHVGPIETVT
jgi:hypothetical protein